MKKIDFWRQKFFLAQTTRNGRKHVEIMESGNPRIFPFIAFPGLSILLEDLLQQVVPISYTRHSVCPTPAAQTTGPVLMKFHT